MRKLLRIHLLYIGACLSPLLIVLIVINFLPEEKNPSAGLGAVSPILSLEKENIPLNYTDDNVGENLLIYTEKSDYIVTVPTPIEGKRLRQVGEHSGKHQFYIGVLNQDVTQNVTLVFTSNKIKLTKLELITKQDKATTTEPAAKENVFSSLILEKLSDKSSFSQIKKPTAGNNFQKSNSFLIPNNQTAFFRAEIEYAMAAKSSEEWFIEAFGDAGGYGHLDPKTVTANGNAQIDTAQSKFGGAAGLFDGVSDSISLNGESDFAFGTGDFTIETFIRIADTGHEHDFYDTRPASTEGVYPTLFVNDTGAHYYTDGAIRLNSTTVLSINTWYHIAVSRKGGVTRLFVDGVAEGGTYTDNNNYLNGGSGRPIMGESSHTAGANELNGWLDELRILKGFGYDTFTVPAAEYGCHLSVDTALLLHMNGTDASTTFTDSGEAACPSINEVMIISE